MEAIKASKCRDQNFVWPARTLLFRASSFIYLYTHVSGEGRLQNMSLPSGTRSKETCITSGVIQLVCCHLSSEPEFAGDSAGTKPWTPVGSYGFNGGGQG